ncbi:hypothetical protein MRB53_029114 [Persea americana]|uniref:Uncharacterized protein n=1 Tax=Persea americana TaxID=3435 RepID=A0ACC2KHF2_PERAE|nr:hypothetical protein MRB53_029114 [Persea americana]
MKDGGRGSRGVLRLWEAMEMGLRRMMGVAGGSGVSMRVYVVREMGFALRLGDGFWKTMKGKGVLCLGWR